MSGSTGRIPSEILDEIIARTDIVDVVGRYVPLKKQGQNYFGLCPFHHEKTPSFSVSQNKQIFYCFSCHAGGNVFKFLMEMEHLSFPEAVRKLAGEVGVKLPEREQSEDERRAMAKRSRLLKWNEYATYYYQAVLHRPQGAPYNAYLDKRGLSLETRERFQLGGCLEGWDGLYRYLKKKGASDEDLIEIGLVSPRNNTSGCYDRFRDRLMFPIKDANGRVIAFGGRIIDAEKAPQKYINSTDSPIFHKGHNVYGLDLAKPAIRAADQVIIVEGYMDVIACNQAGITNVVAPLGTALTEDQVKLLMRYTYNFVTSFDGDDAGVRATLRSLELIENAGGKARVLAIPDRKDPDEYIKAYGAQAFRTLLQNAGGGYVFRLAEAEKKYPGEGMEQKLSVLAEVLPYLAKIRHAAELDMAVRHTASKLFLSEQAVQNELAAYKRGDRRRNRYETQEEQATAPAPETIAYPKNEVVLLDGILAEPALSQRVEEAGGRVLFRSPLRSVYEDFLAQCQAGGKCDSAGLDAATSSIFATALMQHPDALPETLDSAARLKIMEQTLSEQQLLLVGERYRGLLNKIGSLEKGGQSDEMEEALIELETIRQKKKQLEDSMRGDKQ